MCKAISCVQSALKKMSSCLVAPESLFDLYTPYTASDFQRNAFKIKCLAKLDVKLHLSGLGHEFMA